MNTDIHELIVMNRDLINSTWQFFVSVHLALFGLVFLIDEKRVTNISRILMAIAYLGFMWVNYRAQIDNYSYLDQLVQAGKELAVAGSRDHAAMEVATSAGWVIDYLFFIYGLAALGGLGLILIPHREKTKEQTPDDANEERKSRLPFA